MYLTKLLNTLVILCLTNTIHCMLILTVIDENQLASLINTLRNNDEDYNDNEYGEGKTRFSVENNNSDYESNDVDIIDYLKRLKNTDFIEDNLRGRKKSLVKRIVPHGYKTPNLEYDRKHGTYFRPLIKLHKTGDVLNYDKLLKRTSNPSDHIKDTLSKFLRNVKNKVDILPPLKIRIPSEQMGKHKEFKRLLELVADRIRKDKLRRDILLRLEQKNELRSKDFQKSGEQNDPFEPKLSPQKQKKNSEEKDRYPEYNFWNYWTYDKTIYQDKCKGNLLNWNGVCIETPPH